MNSILFSQLRVKQQSRLALQSRIETTLREGELYISNNLKEDSARWMDNGELSWMIQHILWRLVLVLFIKSYTTKQVSKQCGYFFQLLESQCHFLDDIFLLCVLLEERYTWQQRLYEAAEGKISKQLAYHQLIASPPREVITYLSSFQQEAYQRYKILEAS